MEPRRLNLYEKKEEGGGTEAAVGRNTGVTTPLGDAAQARNQGSFFGGGGFNTDIHHHTGITKKTNKTKTYEPTQQDMRREPKR